jgi:Breast carcinoma amplified sequence 2 (BCAS2)
MRSRQSAIQTPLRPREVRVVVLYCSAIVMAPENNKQPAPLFDSLPYYDNDLETHPILREKVQHEVAVETQKIHQEVLHPRVQPPIDLFVVSPSNE